MPGAAASMVSTVVAGVCVVAHTADPPSDQEWNHYLDLMERRFAELKAIIVVTEGGAPEAKQRASLSKFWEKKSRKIPSAVLSPSTFVRAFVNAFGWMAGDRIQAFGRTDFDAAFNFLGLTADQRVAVSETLQAQLRELGQRG